MSTKIFSTICKTSLVFGLGLCWIGQAEMVSAQGQPDAVKQAELAKLVGQRERESSAVVRGTSPFDAAGKKAVEDMVDLYMQFMRLNEEPTNASTARTRVTSFFASTTRSKPEVRSAIAERMFSIASIIVADNALPAASRINALWTIAELDQTPTTNTPPVPFAKATGYLFGLIRNEAVPIYLRSIALSGLERHARILAAGWSLDQKNAIAVECDRIINSQPATNLQVQGHAWMVRKAFDLLTTMNSFRAGKVAIERFADTKTLPSVRLASAKYLSNFDLSVENIPKELKLTIFLAALQLANSECAGWITQQQNLARLNSGGGMGMGGYGGMDGGMGGMGMDGGMGGMGMEGGMGGYGGMDGGMGGMGMDGGMGGYGGMDGMGMQGTAKPVDIQTWDCRLARRKVNVFAQVCHQLLFGIPYNEPKDGKKTATPAVAKTGPNKGGVANGNFRTVLPEQALHLLLLQDAYDKFQTALNERTITDIGTLQTRLGVPSNKLKLEIEKIPGYEKYLPPRKPRPGELVAATNPETPSGEAKPPAANAPAGPASAPTGVGKAPGAPPANAGAAAKNANGSLTGATGAVSP